MKLRICREKIYKSILYQLCRVFLYFHVFSFLTLLQNILNNDLLYQKSCTIFLQNISWLCIALKTAYLFYVCDDIPRNARTPENRSGTINQKSFQTSFL